ncbi:uncharacterized protein LOC141578449 [Camelus bactrianus]|uniref:Uncharacterized protein LOC141578449 n=1 Tax=Camelus bactrianus TaxID=9837 RepID=A0AC58QRV3_CAMBA
MNTPRPSPGRSDSSSRGGSLGPRGGRGSHWRRPLPPAVNPAARPRPTGGAWQDAGPRGLSGRLQDGRALGVRTCWRPRAPLTATAADRSRQSAWRIRGLSPRGGRPPWRPWKSWRRPSSPSSPSSGRRLSPLSRQCSRRRLTRYRRRLSPLSRYRRRLSPLSRYRSRRRLSRHRSRRRFSPLSRYRRGLSLLIRHRSRRLSRCRRRFSPLSRHRRRLSPLSQHRSRRRRRRLNPLSGHRSRRRFSRHRSRRRLSLYRRRLSPLSRHRSRRRLSPLSRHRSLNRHRRPSTVGQEPLHRRKVKMHVHNIKKITSIYDVIRTT